MTNKRMITTIVLVISLLIIIVKVPIISVLGFYDDETEAMIAYHPVTSLDTFQIIFVHSIHLTDVTEKYDITTDNKIKQTEMIFSQFGIGMPSEVKEHEVIDYKDGFYHLTQMNNVFEMLHIRNGKTVSEHRFKWQLRDGETHEVYLNNYMDPGATFILKVDSITLLDMWKEVKIHE